MPFTIGLDYGTNSARALVVDCKDGREIGTAVVDYPSGHQGILLNPADHHLARQNPADYLFALETATRQALHAAQQAEPSFSADQVIGIGMDGTGSSPIPVDAKNIPLAFDERFKHNPNAQCWLWKDHTSIPEAAAITETARRSETRSISRKSAAPIRPSGSGRKSGTASRWIRKFSMPPTRGSSFPISSPPCSPA